MAGLSLADLAYQVHYSKGYLSKVETGRARGSPQLAVLCDVVLGARGDLTARMQSQGGDTACRSTDEADSSRSTIDHGLSLLVALDSAHDGLRQVARGGADLRRRAAEAVRAVQDSGLYAAREQFIVLGSAASVMSAEAAFRMLIEIRNAVRLGADLESVAYHRAYHLFCETLWAFRMTLRAESGQSAMTPAQMGLADWTDRDRCPSCG